MTSINLILVKIPLLIHSFIRTFIRFLIFIYLFSGQCKNHINVSRLSKDVRFQTNRFNFGDKKARGEPGPVCSYLACSGVEVRGGRDEGNGGGFLQWVQGMDAPLPPTMLLYVPHST